MRKCMFVDMVLQLNLCYSYEY